MKTWFSYVLTGALVVGILVSWSVSFEPGIAVGQNFLSFLVELIKIFPPALLLIGLFEAWIDQKTVERHLGEESGARGFLWALILAVTTMAPFIVAIPIAHSLRTKGARLSVVLAYLGAAGVCRLPMTIFEASFLGIRFTMVRWTVSLVLIVVTSLLLGRFLERKTTIEEA